MRNIKITIEYDGTNYSGWQIQRNTDQTIQQILQDVLTEINKKKVKLIGAGRTDAGVHALGQVANFILHTSIPVNKIPVAVNRLLPADIVCKNAVEVDMSFHARYDAIGKHYRYRILNQVLPSAFSYRYAYHYIHKLDIQKINEAARHLIGRHDFSSFQASGSSVDDSVRTISQLEVKQEGNEVWIDVWGDGFLYKMVRIIAGTLIEVGSNKIEANRIPEIIRARNRKEAGFTAPANGLTLVDVYY